MSMLRHRRSTKQSLWLYRQEGHNPFPTWGHKRKSKRAWRHNGDIIQTGERRTEMKCDQMQSVNRSSSCRLHSFPMLLKGNYVWKKTSQLSVWILLLNAMNGRQSCLCSLHIQNSFWIIHQSPPPLSIADSPAALSDTSVGLPSPLINTHR